MGISPGRGRSRSFPTFSSLRCRKKLPQDFGIPGAGESHLGGESRALLPHDSCHLLCPQQFGHPQEAPGTWEGSQVSPGDLSTHFELQRGGFTWPIPSF